LEVTSVSLIIGHDPALDADQIGKSKLAHGEGAEA